MGGLDLCMDQTRTWASVSFGVQKSPEFLAREFTVHIRMKVLVIGLQLKLQGHTLRTFGEISQKISRNCNFD